MRYIQSTIAMMVILLFIILGCAKVPEKLITPIVRIDIEIQDNQEIYSLKFSSNIQNENNDTALIHVKGTIDFINPGNSNTVVMTFPIDIPIILPFDAEIINIEKKGTEKEIMPVIDLLGIDKEELYTNKGIDNVYVDEKYIKLKIISYEKKNIFNVLKGKNK